MLAKRCPRWRKPNIDIKDSCGEDEMHARVTTVDLVPGKEDEIVDIWRKDIVPLVKAQAGFKAAYVFGDTETHRGMSVTLWESEADMKASEESGAVQEALSKFVGLFAGPPTQERFEVLLEV
jgi:heme-degrading monooxygenase HmoA